MRFLTTLVAAALLAAPVLAAEFAAVGKPAPDFSATDQRTGNMLTLESLRGKPVVLEWNNFGCPFVRAHYAENAMQQLQKESIANGAEWISINSSAKGKEGYLADAAAVKRALAEHQSNTGHYLLDHDGKIGRAYGATTTPHMFVIDKQGTLVYAGAINDKPSADPKDIPQAKNYVSAALAALKSGRKVEPAHTQPYGCGVKYGF